MTQATNDKGMIRETTRKTRVNKDSEKRIETKMMVDFTGVSQEQLIDAALDSIVIWRQAGYRDSGVIPATDSFKASEFFQPRPRGPRGPATPEQVKAKAATIMTPDQLAEWAREILKQEKAAEGKKGQK